MMVLGVARDGVRVLIAIVFSFLTWGNLLSIFDPLSNQVETGSLRGEPVRAVMLNIN